ncbi:ABC transporter substrate-binding protein [Undibacterium sp. TJN25]|uniref:ABC transporter substrate-binding protein n=1 Tax=Undibacterium sp. TJN25 TaxID=3413056 RepID=UPI003BF06339
MKIRTIALAIASTLAFSAALPAAAQVAGDKIRIGFISDMSGTYSDLDGRGGAEAIKMAVADFGGTVLGKKIEVLTYDHQNKPDNAVTKARQWFDEEGVGMVIHGANSAAALAVSKLAADKKKLAIVVSAGSARLTNEDCNPNTIHYSYDTVALARVAGSAIVKQGGKTWYFVTADFAFGKSLESDTTKVIKAAGGTILGSVKHPQDAADFSSYIITAQASKAQIIGFANSGNDTINAIKTANAFGVNKSARLAGLLIFISDVHALGLNVTQGMYLADSWYWDMNNDTRAWSKRFYAKMKMQPTSSQAGDYSATLTYLNAIKATGTDNSDKVIAYMKANKINDMFAKNGTIRPDGRMVHDMYLMQVKSPAESKYPWDYYKLVQTVPGDQAFTPKSESACALWK